MSSTAHEPISVRSFGSTEIATVHSGLLHWSPRFTDGQDWRPGAVLDGNGRSVLGINGMIARTARAVIVIDPNALTAEDAPRSAELIIGASIDAALQALSIDPADVTHVVVTHGHADHCTGVLNPRGSEQLRFANAEHLFPAADQPRDGLAGHHTEAVRHVLRALENAGRLRLTHGDVDLADGVALLAAPGETEGHQVVRFECGNDRVYYLGDLIHYPAEVEHIDWLAIPERDATALAASRQRVFSDPGEKRGTFVFTHGSFPGWGTIDRRGQDGWAWRYA